MPEVRELLGIVAHSASASDPRATALLDKLYECARCARTDLEESLRSCERGECRPAKEVFAALRARRKQGG